MTDQCPAETGESLITKSGGTTPSEKYLAGLCNRAFLSLWSYPNVFRDQGIGKNGEGKEVCDLLVVFGNDIILFSDKSCEFPSSGHLATDWSRWFKRAIERSAKQLYGGQRWIREHPERLFLDKRCQTSFPIPLPPMETCRFHLVVVALGAKVRCKQEVGGSGSLILVPEITGQNHMGPDCQPLCIGDIDPSRDFVHVLDDVTLDTILGELDTVGDFVDYLSRKEQLIRSGKLAAAEGEENLLSYYVTTMGDNGHDFVFPKEYEKMFVPDGQWEKHCQSQGRARKKAADTKSYLWDKIIEDFTTHVLNGTSLPGSVTGVSELEAGVRIMASERRIMRRMCAEALIDRVLSGPPDKTAIRTLMSNDDPTQAYVFIAMPEGENESENRRYRREFLIRYCFVLSWKHRQLRTIVGIATESGRGKSGRSYDLLVERPQEWTPELIADAKRVQEDLDILYDENIKTRPFHGQEYPDPPKRQRPTRPAFVPGHPRSITAAPRLGRNSRCPCGSGKKFKHCCMRR